MDKDEFIEYIGDYRVHESRIKAIKSAGDTIEISLKSQDGEIIIVKFLGVKSVNANRAEGMILYAIAEVKEQYPLRKFVFINWDEEDEASLEIIAHDYLI